MSSESSAGAALPKGWQAFAAKPDETTAKAVAKVLQEEMNPSQADASMKLIAKTLAERSARERSKLSRLIASQLRGDIARGFVKAAAATRLAYSTVETPKEEVPQDKDVLHYLDLQLPKKVNALPEKTPGGRDRLVLEGLDLAAAGKVTVDLIALEERIADESDASTMGHLRKALELVTTIGGKPVTYSEERRTELASTVREFARAEALLQDLVLDLTGNDEAQLVIHMLRHGHRDELALVRHAAGNAEFVDEFCWPIDPKDRKLGSSYVEGIPLLLRGAPTGRVDKLFETLAMIDRRDSFSFLRTSYVGGIPGPYARINTGHESRESMVEYFYAFGHLATSTLPGAKVPSTTPVGLDPLKLDSVKEHLAALFLITDTDDSGIKRYRNNIVASYCAFGIQNVRPKPHMVPLLIDFFAESTGGVTIETQRYLARELFPWVQKDPIPADLKILTALYHAALILPSWSFKPFAAQLKLDTVGDSEQARRLRALVGKTLTG
ncbi:hypothetical protein ACWEN6_24845 [Sphaerisporangium sp. NPDC004334]